MATVSAKITGKVREVLIEEGQHVEAGQVMATLDPIDADAQRDLAAAQLGAARSQAGSVQAQLREAEANTARLGSLAKQQQHEHRCRDRQRDPQPAPRCRGRCAAIDAELLEQVGGSVHRVRNREGMRSVTTKAWVRQMARHHEAGRRLAAKHYSVT
jgi:multidrug resistance efflux pump